jgi:hypothetical protein
MTDRTSTVGTAAVPKKNDPAEGVDAELVGQLVEQARAAGLQLTGEGGLLQQLTRRVVEAALDGEITDHLGYDEGDPAGKNGQNSRNGSRGKTVLTEVGPVDITVPRDRDGSFAPQIVKKRQRRLTGVEDMVISLSAKGLTTGEIQAHLAEVDDAQVSLPGRGAREDPRRQGRQPADLRRPRGHGRGHPRHPWPVGRRRRGGRQVLAASADRVA